MRNFSLKISISFHCLHMEHTRISSDADVWLLSTGLGHTVPKFVFPSSLSFRTYQYSIPNQHAMSQGALPCYFIHLPRITLQLCMTSMLPSLQRSVKPHHSWADSPRDMCLWEGSDHCRRQLALWCRAVGNKACAQPHLTGESSFHRWVFPSKTGVALLGCAPWRITWHGYSPVIIFNQTWQLQPLRVCTNMADISSFFIVR